VTEPLSVLHVVPLVGPGGEFGGPVSVAEEDARELSARGHTVTVAGLRLGPHSVPAGLSAAQWRTFPARRIVPRTGMLGMTNLHFVRFLLFSARGYDVWHLHAGRDLVSLAALAVARLRHVPFVAQTHGMVRPRTRLSARLFDAAFLRLLRRAAVVLYLTDGEQAELRQMLGSGTQLRFLSNGLRELPAADRHEPGSSARRVMFLARLHPVKRATAFAEAAAVLRDRGVDAEFVVHGPDQGDLAALRATIRRLRLEGVVRYGGPLNHDEAVAALSGADAYVLPSTIDWMPMSLLEALGMGVPSVCTDGCGLAPVLRDTGAAVVTDGSVEALADAVQSILGDPATAARLSAAGRRLVRDRFSISSVARDLETVYLDALAATASATRSTTRSRPASADR
jgi:glycosyltransferase involved in cell wall biosynthesis